MSPLPVARLVGQTNEVEDMIELAENLPTGNEAVITPNQMATTPVTQSPSKTLSLKNMTLFASLQNGSAWKTVHGGSHGGSPGASPSKLSRGGAGGALAHLTPGLSTTLGPALGSVQRSGFSPHKSLQGLPAFTAGGFNLGTGGNTAAVASGNPHNGNPGSTSASPEKTPYDPTKGTTQSDDSNDINSGNNQMSPTSVVPNNVHQSHPAIHTGTGNVGTIFPLQNSFQPQKIRAMLSISKGSSSVTNIIPTASAAIAGVSPRTVRLKSGENGVALNSDTPTNSSASAVNGPSRNVRNTSSVSRSASGQPNTGIPMQHSAASANSPNVVVPVPRNAAQSPRVLPRPPRASSEKVIEKSGQQERKTKGYTNVNNVKPSNSVMRFKNLDEVAADFKDDTSKDSVDSKDSKTALKDNSKEDGSKEHSKDRLESAKNRAERQESAKNPSGKLENGFSPYKGGMDIIGTDSKPNSASPCKKNTNGNNTTGPCNALPNRSVNSSGYKVSHNVRGVQQSIQGDTNYGNQQGANNSGNQGLNTNDNPNGPMTTQGGNPGLNPKTRPSKIYPPGSNGGTPGSGVSKPGFPGWTQQAYGQNVAGNMPGFRHPNPNQHGQNQNSSFTSENQVENQNQTNQNHNGENSTSFISQISEQTQLRKKPVFRSETPTVNHRLYDGSGFNSPPLLLDWTTTMMSTTPFTATMVSDAFLTPWQTHYVPSDYDWDKPIAPFERAVFRDPARFYVKSENRNGVNVESLLEGMKLGEFGEPMVLLSAVNANAMRQIDCAGMKSGAIGGAMNLVDVTNANGLNGGVGNENGAGNFDRPGTNFQAGSVTSGGLSPGGSLNHGGQIPGGKQVVMNALGTKLSVPHNSNGGLIQGTTVMQPIYSGNQNAGIQGYKQQIQNPTNLNWVICNSSRHNREALRNAQTQLNLNDTQTDTKSREKTIYWVGTNGESMDKLGLATYDVTNRISRVLGLAELSSKTTFATIIKAIRGEDIWQNVNLNDEFEATGQGTEIETCDLKGFLKWYNSDTFLLPQELKDAAKWLEDKQQRKLVVESEGFERRVSTAVHRKADRNERNQHSGIYPGLNPEDEVFTVANPRDLNQKITVRMQMKAKARYVAQRILKQMVAIKSARFIIRLYCVYFASTKQVFLFEEGHAVFTENSGNRWTNSRNLAGTGNLATTGGGGTPIPGASSADGSNRLLPEGLEPTNQEGDRVLLSNLIDYINNKKRKEAEAKREDALHEAMEHIDTGKDQHGTAGVERKDTQSSNPLASTNNPYDNIKPFWKAAKFYSNASRIIDELFAIVEPMLEIFWKYQLNQKNITNRGFQLFSIDLNVSPTQELTLQDIDCNLLKSEQAQIETSFLGHMMAASLILAQQIGEKEKQVEIHSFDRGSAVVGSSSVGSSSVGSAAVRLSHILERYGMKEIPRSSYGVVHSLVSTIVPLYEVLTSTIKCKSIKFEDVFTSKVLRKHINLAVHDLDLICLRYKQNVLSIRENISVRYVVGNAYHESDLENPTNRMQAQKSEYSESIPLWVYEIPRLLVQIAKIEYGGDTSITEVADSIVRDWWEG